MSKESDCGYIKVKKGLGTSFRELKHILPQQSRMQIKRTGMGEREKFQI